MHSQIGITNPVTMHTIIDNLYWYYTHSFILAECVRTYLGLQEDDVGEINPDTYPDYKVKCNLINNGTAKALHDSWDCIISLKVIGKRD
jgi:hypothetical protein